MPFTPYANQKTIRIHKPKVDRNFLQIPNADWMAINKTLGPYGLQLYLYLAANADGYSLNLSPQNAENDAGIRRTTFYEYMKKLEIHGYLVWKKSNVYDFYTTARPTDERSHPDHHNDSLTFESDPPCEPTISCESAAGTRSSPENIPHPQCEPECSPSNIVIDNIYRTEDGTNKYIDKADACIRTHPTPIAEKNSPSLPVPRRMRHWPGLD